MARYEDERGHPDDGKAMPDMTVGAVLRHKRDGSITTKDARIDGARRDAGQGITPDVRGAMDTITAALEPLSPAARRRVLRQIANRMEAPTDG
jgi:hypothetical protein